MAPTLDESPVIDVRTRRSEPHFPAEAGLWVFIMGDLVIFGLFFSVIGTLRAQHPEVFLAGQAELHVGLGTINTVVLLTGSWFVARAVRHLHEFGSANPNLFLGALGCAVAF